MSDTRGLRVMELAVKAGIHRATVWRWLTGRVRPSRLALARLAALGIVLQLPAPSKPTRRGRR